jgi:hypothetical protein
MKVKLGRLIGIDSLWACLLRLDWTVCVALVLCVHHYLSPRLENDMYIFR